MEEKEIKSIEKDLIAFNRYGGFANSGKEYWILNSDTPTPWCNVLANENFGTIVSTKGIVYTYFKNSREFKITNWANDWTSLDLGERISGMFEGQHNLIYGLGYVIVKEEDKTFKKRCKIFVPTDTDVKVQNFKIENISDTEDVFELEYTLLPCLGVSYDVDSENITSKEYLDDTILLKNPYSKYFGDCVCYFSAVKNSSTKMDVEVNKDKYSIKVKCYLKPGEIARFTILLGAVEEENLDTAKIKIDSIKLKYSDIKSIDNSLKAVKKYWEEKVVRNFDTR
ncbi:MAG: hypothetical protein IJ809_01735 [Clostridia bacterium]|nr:hypothetical protein [Clostridia bacterium]